MGKRTVVNEDISNEAHQAALKLLSGIGSYFAEGDRTTNEIIFVPMAIMARIVRVHEATLVLLKEGYVSEAAILTPTAFELRVDLLDVASDIKRATAWVEHDDHKQKSAKMKPNSIVSSAKPGPIACTSFSVSFPGSSTVTRFIRIWHFRSPSGEA